MKKIMRINIAGAFLFCLSISQWNLALAEAAQWSPSVNPILLMAHLDTQQVDNPLIQPQNANMGSLPFYTKQCESASKPTAYPNAKGEAIMLYNPKTKTLNYTIVFSGLSGPPQMAHFHVGPQGKAGPIVQSICGMPPPNQADLGSSNPDLNGANCPSQKIGYLTGSYILKGNPTLKLTAAQEEKQLLNGQLYINFHTCLNMAGEIRGQILPV